MNHTPTLRAVSRARWLAELSATLDEAQILLARLAAERIDRADADLLRMRVEQLRSELRLLHRRGFASNKPIELPRPLHPEWQARRD